MGQIGPDSHEAVGLCFLLSMFKTVDNNLKYICLHSKDSKIDIPKSTKPCTNAVQTDDD